MGLPEIEAAHWQKPVIFAKHVQRVFSVCVAQRFDVVETYFDTLLCASDYKRRCARLISTLLNLAFNKKLETGGPKFTAKGNTASQKMRRLFKERDGIKGAFPYSVYVFFPIFHPSLLLNFCNQALFDFN